MNNKRTLIIIFVVVGLVLGGLVWYQLSKAKDQQTNGASI
jgi:hypothetical protein